MPDNRLIKWGGATILFLILANILMQFFWNWGLITVKVQDAPLSKVISSIEWQGWVKIYTNLPPDAKVTMYVDHVPLAEAMETLAANVGGPPAGAERFRNGGPNGNAPGGTPPDAAANTNAPTATPPTAPGGTPPDATANNTNAPAGTPPTGGPGGGGPDRFAGGGPGAGGPPGEGRGERGGRGGRDGRGGFGGGGFGGGATWNLGFFVAPSSAQVKAEIQAFQSGATDDDTKVYTYQTPLQMLSGDPDMPVADPRKQTWPGYKAPDLAAAAPATPTPDGQTPPAPVDPGPPTIQTYLQAFAESSNIWIMTPGSWASETPPPPANPSIIKAIKNFVSSTHGAVTEAIILRVGRGARGGGDRGGGGFADMESMQDRMRNAINGLPDDAKAEATGQLEQEVQFYQQVKTAPQDQQGQMIREHIMAKLATIGNNPRRSPEKRAARYARAVGNREAVKGK